MEGNSQSEGRAHPLGRLYETLTDDDVLLGRGKKSYNHEGNVRFRKYVLEHADAYSKNDNKSFRKALARQVIDRVESNGGRFLRPIENADVNTMAAFEGVPPSAVLTKVKQALRDMAAGIAAATQQTRTKAEGEYAIAPAMSSLQFPAANSTQPILNSMSGTMPFVGGASFQLPGLSLPPNSLGGVGTGQSDLEYSRLLQIAALQKQIQEREQTAMMMHALEQQRTLQMAQLLGQQATVQLGSGLTQQQQELLLGMGSASATGQHNMLGPSNLLGNSFSLSAALASPQMGGSSFGQSLFPNNNFQQMLPPFSNGAYQPGGQLPSLPNFSAGVAGPSENLQEQIAATLSRTQSNSIQGNVAATLGQASAAPHAKEEDTSPNAGVEQTQRKSDQSLSASRGLPKIEDSDASSSGEYA